MGKTHKKAVLIAMLAAAALAGTAFALCPAWGRHRAEEKQGAMLSRLEISVREKGTNLQAGETGFHKELVEAVKAADTAVLADTLSAAAGLETKKEPVTLEEPGMEKKPETVGKAETVGVADKAAEPAGEKTGAEAQETVKTAECDMPRAGAEIGILSIPKIDARLPVAAGVSKEQLKVSEGWVMQTSMIGSGGNAVIVGHRSYTYGKHFNRLGELEVGDEIFFAAADGAEIRFAVNEILTVLPDDPVVFDSPPEGTAQLTLYTCTPVKVATHRLLVRAVRVEE